MKKRTRPATIFATLLLGFNLNLAHSEPSAHIDMRDFDLRKPQDVAALYTRIERMAASVCQAASSPWDAGRVAQTRKCVAGTIDAAVVRANVSALTAVHEAKRRDASKVAGNSP